MGNSLGLTVAPVVRRFLVVDSGLRALVAVPRIQAMTWMRASGCEGLFVRPFYTDDTASELRRDRFALLWARGADPAKAAELWRKVQDMTGVVGLMVAAKDLAIRVTSEANIQHVQAQLRMVCNQARLHTPVTGARWWCLERLEEQELWRIEELVCETGLQLLGQVSRAKMSANRWKVFFRASGSPTKSQLDDGSWTSSAAVLVEAKPPTQRPTSGTSALSAASVWGGARKSMTAETPESSSSTSRPTSMSVRSVGGGPVSRPAEGQRAKQQPDGQAGVRDRKQVRILTPPRAATPTPSSPGNVVTWSQVAGNASSSRSGGGVSDDHVVCDAVPSLAPSAFSAEDRAMLHSLVDQAKQQSEVIRQLEGHAKQQAEVIKQLETQLASLRQENAQLRRELKTTKPKTAAERAEAKSTVSAAARGAMEEDKDVSASSGDEIAPPKKRGSRRDV